MEAVARVGGRIVEYIRVELISADKGGITVMVDGIAGGKRHMNVNVGDTMNFEIREEVNAANERLLEQYEARLVKLSIENNNLREERIAFITRIAELESRVEDCNEREYNQHEYGE